MQDQYGISDLAKLIDLPIRTIRFYLQKGLIKGPHGAGRGAWYDSEHLEQLLKIKRWQSAGLSLERIQQLLLSANAPEMPTIQPKAGDMRVISHLYLDQGLTLMLEPAVTGISSEQLRALVPALIRTYQQVIQSPLSENKNGVENE